MIRGLIILVLLLVLVIVAGLVVGLFTLGVKLFKSDKDKDKRTAQEEETRLIQELYQGMSRMERRVEALETLLMDREAKDRNDEGT